MLGEATEAEDVVQDAYLRWERSDRVAVPEAWLTKVVVNLCLNRLTSARVKREQYVGPWLPEPVFTDGLLDSVERRDTVSLGLLVLLERLTPPERAVFVLREAFDYGHRDIGELLDLTEAHVRQLYRRARAHVGEPRARFTATRQERKRIVERFLAAALDGDMAGLERLLAEDVVVWADGGGKASAALRPVLGRDKVLRVLVGLGGRLTADMELTIEVVNGEPAVVVRERGVLTAVAVPELVDGHVVAMHAITNPDKLAFLNAQAA